MQFTMCRDFGIVLIFLIVGSSLANSAETEKEVEKSVFDGNSLLDSLLLNLRNDMKSLDKISLTPFNYSHALAKVDIPIVEIQGLGSVTRFGEVSVGRSGSELNTAFALGWQNLITDADLVITNIGIPRKGNVNVLLENVTSTQTVSWNTEEQKPVLEMYRFAVDNVKVDVTGFGEIGKIISQVITKFIDEQKDYGLQTFSIIGKEIFNAAVEEIRASVMSTTQLPISPVLPVSPILPLPI